MRLPSSSLIAFLFALFALPSFAAEPTNVSEAMDALAKDLASLQEEVEATKPASRTNMPEKLRIVKSDTAVFKGANASSGVLTKLPEGESLPVVDKAGDWYAVMLDKDNKRTGWVPASSAAPEATLYASPGIGTDGIYQALLNKVKAIQAKYSSNPYVKITGFSVDISIPPAVSLEFEFK